MLYHPGNQYFLKRLTNKGKLKHASKFEEKFPDVLSFFRNFLQANNNLRPCIGHIWLRTQDFFSLSLLKEWFHYNEELVASFAIMDLRIAPMTTDQDTNSWDLKFFTYIQRLWRMSELAFIDPYIWLWIQSSKEQMQQSADFVKLFLPIYETMHSIYCSSENEHLDNTKTQAPIALVFLLFFLK